MSKHEENGSAAGAAPFDPDLATVAGIQKRVDALAEAMVAKALKMPHAEFAIRSEARHQLHLGWDDKTAQFGHHYEFFALESIEATFAKAAECIASLPTPEQARLKAFTEALGAAIERGKEADIDVEYVNPLLALMKKLSKNALEHRARAAITKAGA